jgi:hypothetical protein
MSTHRLQDSKIARRTVLLVVTTMLTGLVFAVTAVQARADWATSTNLAATGQRIVNSPAIAYDGTGRAYAVWTDYRWPSDDAVYLRERPSGGPWGAPQLLPTAGTGYVRDLVISLNATGDVVLAWRGNGITAMRRPAGGSWSGQQTWSSPGTAGPGSGCPNAPVVDVGDDGSIVVAWTSYQSCNGSVSQWRVMATRYSTVNGWETTPTVWAQSPVDVNSTPAVTVDESGAAVLAFTARNAGSADQLWTVEGSAAGWGTPVMRGASSWTGYAPDITSRGDVTALGWWGTNAAWGLVRSTGAWGSAQPLPGGSPQGITRPPSVAIGASGTVYEAWTSSNGTNLVAHVATKLAGDSFTDGVVGRPGVNSQSPVLASNDNGDLVAIWDEIIGGKWRAVSSLRPTGQDWPATPNPVSVTPSDNTTQARAVMDVYGHALVAAMPLTSGLGTELDVALETRDPAIEPTSPVTVAPAVATVGDTLTCDPSGFGGTPPFRYNYRWLREGSPVPGATGGSYVAQAADAELGIACEVTANNEAGSALSISDAVVIGAVAPAFTSATSMQGTVDAGETVTCQPGAVTGAPAPDLTYVWLSNGVPIDSETASTYDIKLGDAGTSLACQVTAVNNAGQDVSASPATVVPAVVGPVLNTKLPPTISGPTNAGIGNTLTCSTGSWSGHPNPTFAFGWTRDGVFISDSYASGYVVKAADAGTTLRCQVTASNIAGDVTVTTTTKRVIDPPPLNTTVPTVKAAAGNTWAVGQTGQCTSGGWKYALTYSYQWLRDSNPIAAGQTYVLTSADAGHVLSCIVAATGRGGSTSAASAGKALAAAPSVITAPTITGTPRPTRTLTCNRGTWSNAASFAFGWSRNGATVGGTTNKYVVATTDVGATIRCIVRATGPGGTTAVTTAGVVVTP